MSKLTNNAHTAHVVLDFDGTCTQIPLIYERYLEQYRHNFNELIGPLEHTEWSEAQKTVLSRSPQAAWMVAGCPAAPGAADPYILADEAAKFILRRRGGAPAGLSSDLGARAYAAFPAPWRPEARDVFVELLDLGIQLHIVSNSSTAIIKKRLTELFSPREKWLARINVHSDARKFQICELSWDDRDLLSADAVNRFRALPAAQGSSNPEQTGRPIYTRRGAYFEAIGRVLAGRLDELPATIFCGDIWEMDLAMPYELGAQVHLLERTAPFGTYQYERDAVAARGDRAEMSLDLSGLLRRNS